MAGDGSPESASARPSAVGSGVPAREPSDSIESPPPEQMGLIHLFGWTACVAAYLAFWQTLQPWPEGFGTGLAFLAILQALGSGAALGGLVLLVARRRRGMPFPVHPGDYLLTVLGLELVLHLPLVILQRFFGTTLALSLGESWVHASNLFSVVVGTALRVWPAMRLTSRRWRFAFALAAAARLAMTVPILSTWLRVGPGPLGIFRSSLELPQGLRWVSLAVFVGVLVVDRRVGRRYPWTHWAGLLTLFWISAVVLLQAAWLALGIR